jgi:SAM-dependent methyltransferase
MRRLLNVLGHRVLPRPVMQWIWWIRGRPYRPPKGAVRFGDLKRLSPISDSFGFDRGTPIDRHYIEAFLSQNASDISGRVLELDNNLYTLRFGGSRVEQSDVLSIEANNLHATIVGDLEQLVALPKAAFDCIVLTQTLQYVFDMRNALQTLYHALKPGGVMLVTAPGVSKVYDDTWPWYWTFTAAAVRRLLENQFGQDAVSVEAYGNVLVATAFLHGVAVEELDPSNLDTYDSNYPVVVAARAVKRKDA